MHIHMFVSCSLCIVLVDTIVCSMKDGTVLGEIGIKFWALRFYLVSKFLSDVAEGARLQVFSF